MISSCFLCRYFSHRVHTLKGTKRGAWEKSKWKKVAFALSWYNNRVRCVCVYAWVWECACDNVTCLAAAAAHLYISSLRYESHHDIWNNVIIVLLSTRYHDEFFFRSRSLSLCVVTRWSHKVKLQDFNVLIVVNCALKCLTRSYIL